MYSQLYGDSLSGAGTSGPLRNFAPHREGVDRAQPTSFAASIVDLHDFLTPLADRFGKV